MASSSSGPAQWWLPAGHSLSKSHLQRLALLTHQVVSPALAEAGEVFAMDDQTLFWAKLMAQFVELMLHK